MNEETVYVAQPKKKNKVFARILLMMIVFFLGSGSMYAVMYFFPLKEGTVNISRSENKVTVTDKGIADAVEKVYDAVVVVENFRDKTQTASGTGFVFKKDGKKAYILTNHHVIANGNKFYVRFTDESRVEVKLVGSDSYADIAVLEIDADKVLAVAEIGKTESLRVGDTVFAVGAPLDSAYSWSVTRGILSGKDRLVEVSTTNNNSSDWIMKVLQTDTAINNGNSGGPLANSNGEVIGVNSLKLVSDGVEGMGFAIPIEDALDYAEKIMSGEKIVRPFLGISMVDVNDSYSLYQLGIMPSADITSGVMVASVQLSSPAAKADLSKGDVIVKLEDQTVDTVAKLRYYLYKYKVGDTIKVTYIRDGKEKTAKVKLVASE